MGQKGLRAPRNIGAWLTVLGALGAMLSPAAGIRLAEALTNIANPVYAGAATLPAGGAAGPYVVDFDGTVSRGEQAAAHVRFQIVEADVFSDTHLLDVTLPCKGIPIAGTVVHVNFTFNLSRTAAGHLSGAGVPAGPVYVVTNPATGATICAGPTTPKSPAVTVVNGTDTLETGCSEIDVEGEPGDSNSGTEMTIC